MTKPEIPKKLYYSISEVKKITGIEAYVLRFWETEFPSLRPRKNKKGHRTYRDKDIELILRIKELLYENKFTITGAREVLAGKRRMTPAVQTAGKPRSVAPGDRDDAELLEHIHEELTDLLATLDEEKTGDIFAE